jgi:prepilin-type N-terminal cleavage/methylation domain-containing protein
MPNKNAGFTLIEIILVTAISGLLLVIALSGQHQLQAKARFDAAVDKTIQNLAYARNFALSNVNFSGGGNDANTVIAGTAIEFNNNHLNDFPLEEMEPVYSPPNATGDTDLTNLMQVPAAGIGACPASQHPTDNDECFEQFMSDGDSLTLSDPGMNVAYVVFIRTSHGLVICHQIDPSSVSVGGACATGTSTPFDFKVSDPEGFTATIEVDPTTGYAKRI